MKTLCTISLLCVFTMSLVYPVLAKSATLEWDRNTEADVKDYLIYGCFTAGCTVLQQPTMLIPIPPVLQPAATQARVSVFVGDITGKEGKYAVSARDVLNESGLSVSVPFDGIAPSAPKNLLMR